MAVSSYETYNSRKGPELCMCSFVWWKTDNKTRDHSDMFYDTARTWHFAHCWLSPLNLNLHQNDKIYTSLGRLALEILDDISDMFYDITVIKSKIQEIYMLKNHMHYIIKLPIAVWPSKFCWYYCFHNKSITNWHCPWFNLKGY